SSEAGCVHVSVSAAAPAVTETTAGAAGTPSGVAHTTSDQAPRPTALTARTRNPYGTPAVRPVTVCEDAAAPSAPAALAHDTPSVVVSSSWCVAAERPPAGAAAPRDGDTAGARCRGRCERCERGGVGDHGARVAVADALGRARRDLDDVLASRLQPVREVRGLDDALGDDRVGARRRHDHGVVLRLGDGVPRPLYRAVEDRARQTEVGGADLAALAAVL